MRYFVKWEIHEGLVGAEDAILKQLEYIEKSGKMKEGGVLLGIRGGYFLFDIDKPAELFKLVGKDIWDNCHVETHLVASYAELSDFLTTELKKAA